MADQGLARGKHVMVKKDAGTTMPVERMGEGPPAVGAVRDESSPMNKAAATGTGRVFTPPPGISTTGGMPGASVERTVMSGGPAVADQAAQMKEVMGPTPSAMPGASSSMPDRRAGMEIGMTQAGAMAAMTEGTAVSEAPAKAAPVGFDIPATLRGNTAHFSVYYDPSLGTAGQQIADVVLASCEADFRTVWGYFGGSDPGHFNVLIGNVGGGAYHYGCGATDLYCQAHTSPLDGIFTEFLNIAEFVEVFSNHQGAGWNCAASNGEGLSRVLATDPYPQELDGFASGASWLDSNRPDFVNTNDPTDRNYVSTGCSTLFLNYLRHQLRFSWNEIVQAGGSTLGQTYQKLTGRTDGFQQFSSLLQAFYPAGTPSGLATDNPFPLIRASAQWGPWE